MLIVRNTFSAKPGMAGKLAAQIKEMATALEMPNHRVMTDLTGDFNTVVFEFEAENLAEFEARFKQYGSDPKIREKMTGYTDLWVSGTRQLFQVVK